MLPGEKLKIIAQFVRSKISKNPHELSCQNRTFLLKIRTNPAHACISNLNQCCQMKKLENSALCSFKICLPKIRANLHKTRKNHDSAQKSTLRAD
jgi:hypothetical protein